MEIKLTYNEACAVLAVVEAYVNLAYPRHTKIEKDEVFPEIIGAMRKIYGSVAREYDQRRRKHPNHKRVVGKQKR